MKRKKKKTKFWNKSKLSTRGTRVFAWRLGKRRVAFHLSWWKKKRSYRTCCRNWNLEYDYYENYRIFYSRREILYRLVGRKLKNSSTVDYGAYFVRIGHESTKITFEYARFCWAVISPRSESDSKSQKIKLLRKPIRLNSSILNVFVPFENKKIWNSPTRQNHKIKYKVLGEEKN